MSRAHRYLPAILLAVAIAAPACAAQSYRGGNARPAQRRAYDEVQRRAYDNGYREGIASGEADARSRRDFSYPRHDDYRDADEGYRRADGDRELYRQAFRQGFQVGYSEAYNRTARTYPTFPTDPSAGRYSSPAAEVGYRDGLEVGRKDARDRDRNDPARSGRYRSADHDYNRRYGPKERTCASIAPPSSRDTSRGSGSTRDTESGKARPGPSALEAQIRSASAGVQSRSRVYSSAHSVLPLSLILVTAASPESAVVTLEPRKPPRDPKGCQRGWPSRPTGVGAARPSLSDTSAKPIA